jgi:hypothetical protein
MCHRVVVIKLFFHLTLLRVFYEFCRQINRRDALPRNNVHLWVSKFGEEGSIDRTNQANLRLQQDGATAHTARPSTAAVRGIAQHVASRLGDVN